MLLVHVVVPPFSIGYAQRGSFAARFRAAAVDEACLTWAATNHGLYPAAALLTSTPQGPPGPHRAARLSLPSRSQAIVRAGRSRFGALQKPRKALEASKASAVTRGGLFSQQSEPSTPHNNPHRLAAVPVCSPVCSVAPWLCAHPKRLAAATHHAPILPIPLHSHRYCRYIGPEPPHLLPVCWLLRFTWNFSPT